MGIRTIFRCPICQKISIHKHSKNFINKRNNIELGIVPVLIKHSVCSHIFLAYLDKNFSVRNYLPVRNEKKIEHPYLLVISEVKVSSLNENYIKQPKEITVY